MPSDQAIHSTPIATYCAELALPTLLTGAVVYVGTLSTWQVGMFAVIPATVGVVHVYRTRQAQKRWAVTRWLVAESQWRHRQAAKVSEHLESTDADRQPLTVDAQVLRVVEVRI